jgi:protein arginine N-methyltransferase 5
MDVAPAYQARSEEPSPVDPLPVEDYVPIFYVGHHESQRPLPISGLMLRQAQNAGVTSSASSL